MDCSLPGLLNFVIGYVKSMRLDTHFIPFGIIPKGIKSIGIKSNYENEKISLHYGMAVIGN